jgi:uncharacterized membrane protein
MIPLLVLTFAFAAFRLAGIGIPYFADREHALRAAVGVMFLFTASAHWGRLRADLVRMVPAVFGDGGIWVSATGVAEILIAIGLQIPHFARAVGVCAMGMLVAIFPANAKAAREHLTLGGRPVPGLWLRLAIQLIFLAALAFAVFPR